MFIQIVPLRVPYYGQSNTAPRGTVAVPFFLSESIILWMFENLTEPVLVIHIVKTHADTDFKLPSEPGKKITFKNEKKLLDQCGPATINDMHWIFT